MFRLLRSTCILLLSLSVAGQASAGVIVDVVPQLVQVQNGVHSYSHNINDHGFVAGSAQSATLAIDIFDDQDDGFMGFEGEFATIVVENLDFDTGGVWGSLLFSAAPGWVNDLGLTALGALNSNGVLDIQILGLGDFWVGNSTLTVATTDTQVEVPEPGTLLLLACGLIGLGGAARRRRG